jgi:hypothetical protein
MMVGQPSTRPASSPLFSKRGLRGVQKTTQRIILCELSLTLSLKEREGRKKQNDFQSSIFKFRIVYG